MSLGGDLKVQEVAGVEVFGIESNTPLNFDTPQRQTAYRFEHGLGIFLTLLLLKAPGKSPNHPHSHIYQGVEGR